MIATIDLSSYTCLFNNVFFFFRLVYETLLFLGSSDNVLSDKLCIYIY